MWACVPALWVKALVDLSFPFLPKEMHQQCTTEMSLSWVLNLLFRFLCRLQFQYSRTTSKPFCRASYGGSGQRTAQPPPSRYWQWHRKHCSVKETKPAFLSWRENWQSQQWKASPAGTETCVWTSVQGKELCRRGVMICVSQQLSTSRMEGINHCRNVHRKCSCCWYQWY